MLNDNVKMEKLGFIHKDNRKLIESGKTTEPLHIP
jgi:hypothetical protein